MAASVLFWSGTIASAGLLLDFTALVMRARLRVGEWPHPRSGNPFDGSYIGSSIDPAEFGLHYDSLARAFPAVFYFVLMATVVLVMGGILPRLRQPPWLIYTFLIVNAIIGIILFVDPHGFFLWFMD